VKSISNTVFGASVTVAGLVPGRDIISTLQPDINVNDTVIILNIMLRRHDSVFIDDLSINDVKEALGCSVITVEPEPADIYHLLCSGDDTVKPSGMLEIAAS